jgi:hypothetical protein
MEQHYRFSTYREKLIEHLFIGDLLKASWLSGERSLEVAKPEVDSRGYDVIIERNGMVRHIQLKTSHRTASAANQKVHIGLGEKPAGCVIWIMFDEHTLELGPFLFYGDRLGGRLPSVLDFKVAKHTKANAQGEKAARPGIREVPKSKFEVLRTIDEVFAALFGDRSRSDITALRSVKTGFHALIKQRLTTLRLQVPDNLPELADPLPTADSPAWWAVSGMYGGFSYWGERDCLIVESWSRVIGGSGQRHEVTPAGAKLLEEGFV